MRNMTNIQIKHNYSVSHLNGLTHLLKRKNTFSKVFRKAEKNNIDKGIRRQCKQKENRGYELYI